jgi:hypothetical protein
MCEAPTAVIGYRVRTEVEPKPPRELPVDANARGPELSTGTRVRPGAAFSQDL